MIVDAFHTHRVLEFIEGHRRHALHEGIGLARHLHTVDDIVALFEMTHHLRNALDVILQIGIDGNHSIGPVAGSHHSGKNGILVPHIAREIDATNILILTMQLFNHLPSAITATVVDKHHHAIVGNQPFGPHALEESCHTLYRMAEHLFLIVTGRYGCKPNHTIYFFTFSTNSVKVPKVSCCFSILIRLSSRCIICRPLWFLMINGILNSGCSFRS